MFHVWVYLQTSPLLGLCATLLAWQGACWLDGKVGHKAWSNPVILSIVALTALLLLTHTSYRSYFAGGRYIQFLLGPATVALAVPMYANLQTMKSNWLPILAGVTAGSLVASLSAMTIAQWLGAPREVVISMGPKSVTTPIAMAIAQNLGGQPSLAAVFVLLTGVIGTIVAMIVFAAARIVDWRARGLAAGTAAHGLATARMLSINQTAGAFGGLALGLNGLLTSIFVPLLVRWLHF